MADYYIALAETNAILYHIEKEFIYKIPKEILNIIEKYKAENINFIYDTTKNISEQSIHKETLEILSYLNYNFWLNNEEKIEFNKIYNDNFIKLENEKREKYNPNEIFSRKKAKIVNDENLPIEIKEEKSFFEKILNKFKAIIKKIYE